MKVKVVAAIILSAVLLAGCGKAAGTGSVGNNSTSSASAGVGSSTRGSTSTLKRVSTDYHFNSVKAGSVPQLTQTQKTQVKENIGSAINDLNSALQSVKNTPDVNISAAQK